MSADRADALWRRCTTGAGVGLAREDRGGRKGGRRAGSHGAAECRGAPRRATAEREDVVDSIADGFESDSSDCERSAPTDVEAKSNFQGPGISLLSEGAADPS